MGRLLAWLGVAGGAAYLVFIGGAWWGIYLPQLRIITVSIITIAIGVWAWKAWRDPSWRPRSQLLPAILVCLGSLAISSVFSRDPRVSVEYLSYSVLLAAGYLLFVRLLARPFFRVRILNLTGLLFVVIAGLFLVRILLDWVAWWTALGRIAVPPLRPGSEALTYGNPSAALTIVALLGAAAAAQWGSSSRTGRTVVVVVGIVVGLVALLSGSRAGWLALAGAAVVLAVLWLIVPANRRELRRSISSFAGSRLALPVGLGGAIVVAGAGAVLLPSILGRLTAGGEELRASYVAIAIRLFAQSPIVGTGPGTWVLQRIHETMPPEVDYYIPHAHDVPAQTLAELGLVGAAAGAFLIASVAWLFIRAARGSDPARRRWAWLGGGALIYLAFHDLLDFYPNFPSVLLVAAIPAAFLDATTQAVEADVVAASWRRPLPAAGLAVVALAAVFALWQEMPALASDQAVAAANRGDFQAAIDPARAAVTADPAIGPYQMTYGLAADRLGDQATAAQAFMLVAERDDLPEAWLDLAGEQASTGDKTAAISSLRSALRLGIQRASVALPAGDLALSLGETDLAKAAFEASLADLPSLAGDAWWQADANRARLFPTLIDDLVALNPAIGWQLALVSGDTHRAMDLAAGADIGQTVALRVIAAWTGVPDALDDLVAACQASPANQPLVGWCARLEARDGNEARASDYRSVLDLENAGPILSAEARVSSTPVIGQITAGDPATYWGFFTYRRATPYDLIVGRLPHLVFE